MPSLLFLGLILLFLLWMLCTWIDERTSRDVPSASVVSEKGEDDHSGEKPLSQNCNNALPLKKALLQPQSGKKEGTLNKDSSYFSLTPQSKIKDQKYSSLGKDNPSDEEPHDHTEYPHETPDALRPRRVIMGRPPEEDEEDEPSLHPHDPHTPHLKENNALSENNSKIRTPQLTGYPMTKIEEEEKPLKSSVETQKEDETEEWSSQTDTPPLRASVGVQAEIEQKEIGVEVSPQRVSRGSQASVAKMDAEMQAEELERAISSAHPSKTSESEEPSESSESYPLKPKYLSSPSQSEEESEQPSSESSGTLRQRYSIIQPFMREEE